MASNFRIALDRNNGSLSVRLNGDFDGSSALELIGVLKSLSARAGTIVVHTCGLTTIHPFGLDVFQKKFSGAGLTRNLKFTGKYGTAIAP